MRALSATNIQHQMLRGALDLRYAYTFRGGILQYCHLLNDLIGELTDGDLHVTRIGPAPRPFDAEKIPAYQKYFLWAQTALTNVIFRRVSGQDRKPNFLHIPHILPWTPAFDGRLIVTVHDTIPLSMPEVMPSHFKRRLFSAQLSRACRLADTIIAVSDITAATIAKLHPSSLGKLVVVSLPVSRDFDMTKKANVPSARSDKVSLLAISGRAEPHKNIERILAAYALITKNNSNVNIELTLVGHGLEPLVTNADLSKDAKRGLTLRTKCSSKQLRQLYEDADILLHPSLMEGFGIPIVEAMATGTCVITSNIEPMSNLATSSCGLLINPYSTTEIVNAIQTLIDDTETRNALVKNGLRRALDFSFDKFLSDMRLVYSDDCNSLKFKHSDIS